MSVLSRVLMFYPGFVILVFASLVIWSVSLRNIAVFFGALVFIYFFPLLCFKLNKRLFGDSRELQRFKEGTYNGWWGGHQIQMIYIAIPILETLLRLIPGLYSTWLRLWGSKIGTNVYWTPHVEILDRDLVEVGDNVVFGHLVKVACHVVSPRKGSIWLFVKKVKISTGSFVGAGTVLGPGSIVKDGGFVPAGSEFFNGQELHN